MASGIDRPSGAASRQPGKNDQGEGLQLSFIQVIASALAAMSGAIVTSAFGVAGTIAGVAVMSVIATSATAVYSHSIKRTRRMLRQPPPSGARRPSRGAAEYGGATEHGGARSGHYGGAAGEEGQPGRPAAGYGGPSPGSGSGGPSGSGGASADSGSGGPAGVYGSATSSAGASRTDGGEQGARPSASDHPSVDAARHGYTAPRTYGRGRRLNRKVGLALGVVLTFVIAVGTLTVIELITGQSSAGLWGQGGNGPSIIGGGDTSAPSPKPSSPASSPTYTGTPTPTSTSSPASTATPSATSSPTATSTQTRTSSPGPTSSPQLRAPSPTARVSTPAASP